MKEANLYESSEYLKHYHKSPGTRIGNILNNISVSDNDIIADFACGNGLLARALNGKYRQYYGIDTSSLFIKQCNNWVKENKIKDTFFTRKEISIFCEENQQKFTKAFTLDFSEHIDDEIFIQLYSSIRKSLKPNSILILHTPNRDFLLEKLKNKGVLPQTAGHIAIRDFQQYKYLLKKSGFKNIQVKYLSHYKRIVNILPTSSKARLLITSTN